MRDETKLRDFLHDMLAEAAAPAPAGESWPELVARVKAGDNQQVCGETYRYFLESVPPHYFGGDYFAFCEGMEPLKLFARRRGTFVCRQFTWDQTATFCELAGIDLPD